MRIASLLVFIGLLALPMSAFSCAISPGYTFYEHIDSAGNDLMEDSHASIDELKEMCDSNPLCMGFNTDGSIKSDIRPSEQWYNKWSLSCHGLYVKQDLCEGTKVLEAPSGVLMSNQPQSKYKSSQHCTWVIKTHSAGVLTLSFRRMDTESGDTVSVYSPGWSGNMVQFAGKDLPEPLVYRTQNAANTTIVWLSDVAGTAQGFAIEYHFVSTDSGQTDTPAPTPTPHYEPTPSPRPSPQPSPQERKEPAHTPINIPINGDLHLNRDGHCQGTITYPSSQSSGTIASNRPGQEYAHGANCAWIIDALPGSTVRLSFSRMDTERQNDELMVTSSDPSKPLLMFSGSETPNAVEYTFPAGGNVYLRFKADSQVQGGGFVVGFSNFGGHRVVASPPPDVQQCHGLVTIPASRPSGTISSNPVTSLYQNSNACEWVIETPGPCAITIHFVRFDTQQGHDMLVITPNGSTDAASTHSGNVIPSPTTYTFRHPGGSLHIRFNADPDLGGRGFTLDYMVIPG